MVIRYLTTPVLLLAFPIQTFNCKITFAAHVDYKKFPEAVILQGLVLSDSLLFSVILLPGSCGTFPQQDTEAESNVTIFGPWFVSLSQESRENM